MKVKKSIIKKEKCSLILGRNCELDFKYTFIFLIKRLQNSNISVKVVFKIKGTRIFFIFGGAMSAQPNISKNFFSLRVVHRKKEVCAEKKCINVYPFGLQHKGYNNTINPNGNSTAQKFGFGGKELNEELGIQWHDFGARNYDASLGRWMNLDPLAEDYISWSPYNYTFNNPTNLVDPDGRGVWRPDSEGNLIAEEGDSKATLATHLNVSEEEAGEMIANQNLETTPGEAGGVATVKEGQTLQVDNNMTRSIKNSDGITTDQELAGDTSKSYDDNDKYNCHGSCKAAVTGQEINNKTANATAPSLADPIFQSNSAQEFKDATTEVSPDQAVFGKTIITVGTSHSAVYYGKSKDGTPYVYSKNGHRVKPEVAKLSKVTKIYNKSGNEKIKYHTYNGNK